MKAGRDLDKLIAERIMGYRFCTLHPWAEDKFDGYIRCDECGDYAPYWKPYSTDIAAAWKVVDSISIEWGISLTGVGMVWRCLFGKRTDIGDGHKVEAEADTAPLAICLAALKAISTSTRKPL